MENFAQFTGKEIKMPKIKNFRDIAFYKATDSYFLELIKKNGTIKGLHGGVITEIWDFAAEVNRVCAKFFKESCMSDEHLVDTDFMTFNKIVLRYLAGENSYNQRIHPGASVTTSITGALDFSRKLLLSDVLNRAFDLCIRGYGCIDGLRHLKKKLKHISNSFPVVMKIHLDSPDLIIAADTEKLSPDMLLSCMNETEDDIARDYLLTADPGLENIEFLAEKNGSFEIHTLDKLISMHNELNNRG